MNLRLKLRKNQSTIPSEKLTPEVRSLEILGDSIEKLPSLDHLHNCANLSLHCPELAGLPSLPPSLEVLKIKGGAFSLPESWPNLKLLQLMHLSLERFPENTQFPKALEILNLSNNHLKDLPVELKRCQKLTRISLDYNQFEVLPAFLYELPSLNHLSLDQNPLSEETKQLLHQRLGLWFS